MRLSHQAAAALTSARLAFVVSPRSRRWGLRSLAALMTLVVPACGRVEPLKPVVPARGEVTLDGKLGSGWLVIFHPTTDPVPNPLDPRAVVDHDGTFRLSTHNAHDGAPPGSYRVTIHDPTVDASASVEEGGPPASASAARSRLPARFADPKRSGLEAVVRPGSPNSFTFRLTR